jgi:hypothetical protein
VPAPPAPSVSVPPEVVADAGPAPGPDELLWASATLDGTPECIGFRVTARTADAPEQVTAYVHGASVTLHVEPTADGVVFHGYSLSASFGSGGMGSGGHCGQARSAHQTGPPPADGYFHADEAACELDRVAGAVSSLSACVENGIASFIAGIPGRKPVPPGDALLAHMQAAKDVWILDGQGCVAWDLVPDSADPSRGAIQRSWREPDGTRVTEGYGYQYRDRLITLSGPGTTTIKPDGSTSGSGMGCADSELVDHRADASEVGGVLWHYHRAGCEAEKQASPGGGSDRLGGC